MHCPSCGQQQISNETKFCSRCGLPLGVVAEVVTYGGYLPQLTELNKGPQTFWTRRNGLWLSLFFFILMILLAIIAGGILDVEVFGELFVALAFFGSALIFIASIAFLKKPVRYASPDYFRQDAAGTDQHRALPPQRSYPADPYAPAAGNWRDTNDLQPSVIENTTQLLEKEARER
jgi:hypothetical protein